MLCYAIFSSAAATARMTHSRGDGYACFDSTETQNRVLSWLLIRSS